MRRIETWFQELNRRRALRRWLAEQRRERYQVPGLTLWLEQDLNLQAPPVQSQRPPSRRAASQPRVLLRLWLGSLPICALLHTN